MPGQLQQRQLNQGLQRPQQIMNGVGDDVNPAGKTLMHTAVLNNGRKVSRPMQEQQTQQATHAQMMALRNQQAVQQATASRSTFDRVACSSR